MIHYTPLPAELIFYDWHQKPLSTREVVIDGVLMEIQMSSESEATIVRLISPNPMDYLKPRFQPGNKLQFVPK